MNRFDIGFAVGLLVAAFAVWVLDYWLRKGPAKRSRIPDCIADAADRGESVTITAVPTPRSYIRAGESLMQRIKDKGGK